MGSDGPVRRLPGYDLLERVAVGGRGEIYLARETAGEARLVAVKLLRAEDVGRADRVQAFYDEVKVSCLLVHPNVVRVYHGDVAPDGVPFLVMEYVDGITVWELLDRAKARGIQVPLGVAAYVTTQVADALAYAHAMKGPDGGPLAIVHRDVSTVNVMATLDGAIKLLDFGIARSNIRSLRTAPGIIKGKLDYLSPEQCTGGPIDSLTDIYSLGVILFELLTRQRPYVETDVARLFEKVSSGKRPRVHDLRPDVSPRLERIVDRAMAISRPARYQSAREMLDDLRACMARLPDVPTSTGLAALVAELAPDRLSAVQSAYGPPETTAISKLADLVEPGAVRPDTTSGGWPPPARSLPLRPASPAPALDVETDGSSGSPPSPAAAGAGPGTPPAPAGAAGQRRPAVPRNWLLAGALGLAGLAVLSGLLLTLAIRGCGAEPGPSVASAVPALVGPDPAAEPGAAPAPPSDEAASTPEPARVEGGAEPAGAGSGGDSAMTWAAPDEGAAAERTVKGLLTVESRRRAAVFVGREKVGLTPLERLELDPGRYRIKVRNRHGVRRRTVQIRTGVETRLEFPL